MYFIQFYKKSAISDDIVEACGDRAVLIIDGRYRQDSYRPIAEDWAKKHSAQEFTHYAIFKGESFSDSRRIVERVTL